MVRAKGVEPSLPREPDPKSGAVFLITFFPSKYAACFQFVPINLPTFSELPAQLPAQPCFEVLFFMSCVLLTNWLNHWKQRKDQSGTSGGTRTHTLVKEADFESAASTNSATLALKLVPRVGLEPTTNWLRVNCSTIELPRHSGRRRRRVESRVL